MMILEPPSDRDGFGCVLSLIRQNGWLQFSGGLDCLDKLNHILSLQTFTTRWETFAKSRTLQTIIQDFCSAFLKKWWHSIGSQKCWICAWHNIVPHHCIINWWITQTSIFINEFYGQPKEDDLVHAMLFTFIYYSILVLHVNNLLSLLCISPGKTKYLKLKTLPITMCFEKKIKP